MNAAVDETEDSRNEPAPTGPGERLRTARQAADMEVERVADRLHLKPADVQALERDEYEGFAARVFVRGYVRNYARLVNLPVDSVLAMFDAAYPDPDRPLELKPVGSHRPQVSSRHGVVRTVSWVLLLGVVALFLVWWAGYLELNGSGSGTEPAALVPATEAPLPAGVPAPLADEGELALPSVPTDGEQSEPGETGQPEAPVEPDAAPTVEAPAEPQPPAAPLQSAAEPAPQPAPVRPEVVLTLAGPCWVEIRDASNSFRLIGALEGGTRRVLEGTPPYRILLGNAPVARLTVNGQPVDLGRYTRGQVARLTLDPSVR